MNHILVDSVSVCKVKWLMQVYNTLIIPMSTYTHTYIIYTYSRDAKNDKSILKIWFKIIKVRFL